MIGNKAYNKKDSVIYFFNADKEGITANSNTNKTIVQNALNKAKQLGYLEFYFMPCDFTISVGVASQNNELISNNAINIPSGLKVKLSNDSVIRVDTGGFIGSALFCFNNVKNSSISGGSLIGDRDTHDYTIVSTHEWNYLVMVRGSQNIDISNMSILDSTSDGIFVTGKELRTSVNYVESKNITIRNNTISNSRRNNISIVDGNRILIENNLISNAGLDNVNSSGTAPRFGIDIESYRVRDVNGVLTEYERVENVIVSNNKFLNNINSSVNNYTGINVEISNNYCDTGIGFSAGNQTKIFGNSIVAASSVQTMQKGIYTVDFGFEFTPDIEIVKDNFISNNLISGFSTGIDLRNYRTKVVNNNIVDFDKGITIYKVLDSEVSNNTFKSSRANSTGIFFEFQSFANGLLFSKNKITVTHRPIQSTRFNYSGVETDYKIRFEDNEINSTTASAVVYVQESNGFEFFNNFTNVAMYFQTVTKTKIIGNNITGDTDGIEFFGVANNIQIKNNIVKTTSAVFLVYAIYINSASNANSNIEISGNEIQQDTAYRCISVDGANNTGFKIFNNIGNIADAITTFLQFTGNNSVISKNRTIKDETKASVTGTGNTII